MQWIHFNPEGNMYAALFWCSLPAILIIGSIIARKRGLGKDRWPWVKRWWYLPILIPFILYYGIIYRWLYFDQFYWIGVKEEGTWPLEYRMPPRTKTINADNIVAIKSVAGDMWTYKMIRISILTKNGKKYISAQVSEEDEEYYIKLLTEYKDKR